MARGFDAMATGHYARVEQDVKTGRWLLKKALDDKKDQTYVLYQLTQQQLAHVLFPLGLCASRKCARLHPGMVLSMPTNRIARISVLFQMEITPRLSGKIQGLLSRKGDLLMRMEIRSAHTRG